MRAHASRAAASMEPKYFRFFDFPLTRTCVRSRISRTRARRKPPPRAARRPKGRGRLGLWCESRPRQLFLLGQWLMSRVLSQAHQISNLLLPFLLLSPLPQPPTSTPIPRKGRAEGSVSEHLSFTGVCRGAASPVHPGRVERNLVRLPFISL